MGFVNPVLDLGYEDDDVLEPERSFSGAFNTFMNHWCVKKDKNAIKLAFRFHAFPKIPEMLETHTHKTLDFQHYRETKIIVFWSNREIKMPRKVEFRLSSEIKISRKSKLVIKIQHNQNGAKSSCCENLLP